eukprot:COSAG06_NODE_4980_length_3811_cov_4.290140_1_plen_592_part_00
MGDAFVQACDRGDADAVRQFLAAGADPNTVDQGFPVLCGAALGGHTATIELLLSANASVDAPDQDGFTPLYIAAANGHTAAIELLLAAKAGVDTPAQDGVTPLWSAANEGHTAAIELLLAAKAGVDTPDQDGVTPLYVAAANGHTAAIELLLGAGAAADAATHDEGFTALMAAVTNADEALARCILRRTGQFDINARSVRGLTALMLASTRGHTTLVRMLIAAGADLVSITGPNSESKRCRAGHSLSPQATPNAAYHCDVCSVRVQKGTVMQHCTVCNYDQCDDCYAGLAEGSTALAIAERKGHTEVATLLREREAQMKHKEAEAAKAPAPAPAPPPSLAERDPYAAELGALKTSALKKHALALGATVDQMDEVDDADDSKAAAIALMLSLRRALEATKVSALKKQLRGRGATDEQMDEIDDADDSKAAAVRLMLQLAAVAAAGGGGGAPPAAAPEPEPVQLLALPLGQRTFATSNFKKAYDVTAVPAGPLEVGAALKDLLREYCEATATPWQPEGQRFFTELQAEAMKNSAELAEADQIPMAAQRMWTSAKRLSDREFCFILNHAGRADTPKFVEPLGESTDIDAHSSFG